MNGEQTEAIPGPIEVPEVPACRGAWCVWYVDSQWRLPALVCASYEGAAAWAKQHCRTPYRIVHIPGSDAKPDARAKAIEGIITALQNAEVSLLAHRKYEEREASCFLTFSITRGEIHDALAEYKATLDGGG